MFVWLCTDQTVTLSQRPCPSVSPWPSPPFFGWNKGMGRGNHRQRRTLSESCTRPMTMINYLFGCSVRCCLECIFVSCILCTFHLCTPHAPKTKTFAGWWGGRSSRGRGTSLLGVRFSLMKLYYLSQNDFSHFLHVFGCLSCVFFISERCGIEIDIRLKTWVVALSKTYN